MATADDAKRAVRGLVTAHGEAWEAAGRARSDNALLRAPGKRIAAEESADALLRASDALIETLRAIEALPTHGRARRYTDMATDALARVAAMGEGRDA